MQGILVTCLACLAISCFSAFAQTPLPPQSSLPKQSIETSPKSLDTNTSYRQFSYREGVSPYENILPIALLPFTPAESILTQTRFGSVVVRKQLSIGVTDFRLLQREFGKIDIRLKCPGCPDWLSWRPIAKAYHGKIYQAGIKITWDLNKF